MPLLALPGSGVEVGVIRGLVQVPYGRRGVTGPTELTIGGEWPLELRDGKWFHRETGEEHEAVPLSEFLERESKREKGG